MTSKQRKYFSGNNVDSALMQAARYHGLAPEEVAYRKIEKRHGFLRTRKAVVIEVDPESPRIVVETPAQSTPPAPVVQQAGTEPPVAELAGAETTATTEPVSEAEEPVDDLEPAARGGDMVWGEADAVDEEPAVPAEAVPETEASAGTDLIEAAERGLQDILEFAMLDLESEIRQGEGELEIELTGPDRGRLIEDRGNLLLSIQHLLPRLIRGRAGRSIPCHVDSESFHETREVELRRLAQEAAAEVRERQQPRTLPPMNPAERRIIHVTLADDKDLNTESQGRGFFKRVTISPAMRRPRGFDRYNR